MLTASGVQEFSHALQSVSLTGEQLYLEFCDFCCEKTTSLIYEVCLKFLHIFSGCNNLAENRKYAIENVFHLAKWIFDKQKYRVNKESEGTSKDFLQGVLKLVCTQKFLLSVYMIFCGVFLHSTIVEWSFLSEKTQKA